MKPPQHKTGVVDRSVNWLLAGSDTDTSSSNDLRQRRRLVLAGALLLVIFLFHELISLIIKESHVDLLLPWSMFYLDRNDWIAVAVTSVASLISFLVTVSVAFGLGIGTALLVKSRKHAAKLAGLSVDMVYRFLFIVPVVLTTTLVITLLLRLTFSGMPAPMLVLGSLLFSSLCIAGYPVYYTIYRGAVQPDRRHELLVDSLYINKRKVLYLPIPIQFAYNKRLNDGQVRNYCDSVERAWHLTIVAVIIVESISPGLYQHLLAGTQDAQVSGVGRLVIEAQSINGTYRVVGFMWALFLFDLLGLTILQWFLKRRYKRHYGRH